MKFRVERNGNEKKFILDFFPSIHHLLILYFLWAIYYFVLGKYQNNVKWSRSFWNIQLMFTCYFIRKESFAI